MAMSGRSTKCHFASDIRGAVSDNLEWCYANNVFEKCGCGSGITLDKICKCGAINAKQI